MVDHRAFALAFQQLCHAFGRPVDMQMLFQYYKALQDLTEPQVMLLVRWAIDNLDTPFPRIAALKQHATAQGWYVKPPTTDNDLVPVICQECGGSFVIRRSQLEQDAAAGRTYRCVNYTFWHCPAFFSAQTILKEEGP